MTTEYKLTAYGAAVVAPSCHWIKQAITAIEEALEQPSDSVEQEPVNIVLDSWDAWASSTEYDNQNHDLLSALKDIRKALAQPEQEPVGVIQHLDELNEQWTKHLPIGTKLYTSPPKRQPLTDEQIDNLGRKEKDALLDFIYENGTASEGSDYFFKKYARSIEAAHGIKETT